MQTFAGGGVVAELHADGGVGVKLTDGSTPKFRHQDVKVLAEGEAFIWGPSYRAPAQPAPPKPKPRPVPPAANGRARKSDYDCRHSAPKVEAVRLRAQPCMLAAPRST